MYDHTHHFPVISGISGANAVSCYNVRKDFNILIVNKGKNKTFDRWYTIKSACAFIFLWNYEYVQYGMHFASEYMQSKLIFTAVQNISEHS